MSPTNPAAGVSRTVDPVSAGPGGDPADPSVTDTCVTVRPRPIGSKLPVSMSAATSTPARPWATCWSTTVASGLRDPVTVTVSTALPSRPSPSTTWIGRSTGVPRGTSGPDRHGDDAALPVAAMPAGPGPDGVAERRPLLVVEGGGQRR